MKRKLTTILCADVERYSALMAADEASTLATLNAYRDLMTECFERHEGRKVNTWGDAVIAEFPSVVEAVQSAIEVQDSIAERNRDLPTARRMWFRMGINLGDVMIDGSDLYGDGVNVAARLQGLADPGGIIVSSTVHEMVRKQIPLEFDRQQETKVKNIEDPVTPFKVRTDRRNWHEVDAESEDESDPLAASGASASVFVRVGKRAEEGWHWLKQQPRSIKVSAGAIGFFTGGGVMFDGLLPPNFLIPASPFALYIYLHARRQRRRAQNGEGLGGAGGR